MKVGKNKYEGDEGNTKKNHIRTEETIESGNHVCVKQLGKLHKQNYESLFAVKEPILSSTTEAVRIFRVKDLFG